MIPEGFVKKEIYDDVSEDDLECCFLKHRIRDEGGFFNYGSFRGFSIGESWYSSETGDSLYDHITINDFEVYKPQ